MSNPAYLTKTLAAKALGISPRRLVELAAAGQIHRHYHNDPKSRRTIALFEKTEIEQLAAQRTLADQPGGSTPARWIEPLLQAIAGQRAIESSTPKVDALWLTPAEAAQYSGLPERFLIGLIQVKQLPALDVGVRPGGRWRIARRDLDAIRAEDLETNRRLA